MSRLKYLIHEAHRRSLWQVLAIYLASSWAALQVTELLAENVGLPEWVTPFAVVLLMIGFPIVMATAFVQEGVPPSIPQGTSASDVPAAMATMRPEPGPDSPNRTRHRWFTWRNAILGGVGAFALLGVLTAGFMTLRTLGVGPVGTLVAQGILTDRAPLVVADMESATGDTLLARAATEAMRVDLAQSPVVRVLESRQVAQVLRRMERAPDAPLDLALATEVAVREGAAAVVTGEINAVGQGFVLSTRLVGSNDGEELVSLRENARHSADIIAAIDRLSKKLRERIGESYRSLRRGQPLDRVTTSSLDALRKYSQGARAIDVSGDEQRGIALLEEAVALDTAFAMAYRKLGTLLVNRVRERARAVDALTRAYNHRDRLTPRERYLTESSYFTGVTWEPDQAIIAYQNLLELDSTDAYALNNAGVVYGRTLDWPRAEQYYLRSVRADSSNALAYTNAVIATVAQGKFEEAQALLTTFARRFPGHPRIREFSARLASSQGDYDTAERELRALRESMRGNPDIRMLTSEQLSHIAATRGRLLEARTHLLDAIAANRERGLIGESLTQTVELALLDLYVSKNATATVKRLDEALGGQPLSQLHSLDRPYSFLAIAYAGAGRPERARTFLRAYDAEVAPELRTWIDRTLYNTARSEIALAEGRASEALLAIAEASRQSGCARCELPNLARAYELAGQPDSALAVNERYVTTPATTSTELFDRWYLAAILERLAAIYDERGNTEMAVEYYGRFIELWKNADPELQPRVTSARSRLQRIMAIRG